jgi:hypothetical protein
MPQLSVRAGRARRFARFAEARAAYARRLLIVQCDSEHGEDDTTASWPKRSRGSTAGRRLSAATPECTRLVLFRLVEAASLVSKLGQLGVCNPPAGREVPCALRDPYESGATVSVPRCFCLAAQGGIDSSEYGGCNSKPTCGRGRLVNQTRVSGHEAKNNRTEPKENEPDRVVSGGALSRRIVVLRILRNLSRSLLTSTHSQLPPGVSVHQWRSNEPNPRCISTLSLVLALSRKRSPWGRRGDP